MRASSVDEREPTVFTAFATGIGSPCFCLSDDLIDLPANT
jgi:hypothetical protein